MLSGSPSTLAYIAKLEPGPPLKRRCADGLGGVYILAIGKFPPYSIEVASNLSSLLSLELGRPALIKEEDCSVSMPSPVDDQHIREDIDWTSPTPEQSTSPLRPMIQVIGGIAKLLRMLKSRRLAKSVLQAYDTHFNMSLQAFPAQSQVRPNDYLDSVELPPMIYLQNARLMLFRHNLSPACEAHERSDALDMCAVVARDTARLLSRCMQESPVTHNHASNESGSWEARMVSAVSAFLCTHIWRCILFLCFRSDWENALWCTRASSTIGDARPINMACGRYLEFFLQQLLERHDQKSRLDTDEEMVAYVSGDLQGSFENSWIWKPTSTGGFNDQADSHIQTLVGNSNGAANKQDHAEHTTGIGGSDLGTWDNVLNILKSLFQEQQEEQQRREIMQNASLRPPLMLPPLAPSPAPLGSVNRMSIRDLI